MPTERTNVTDKEQYDLEIAAEDSTIPVFDDSQTRHIGNPLGAGANSTDGSKGRVAPHDDKDWYDIAPGKAS